MRVLTITPGHAPALGGIEAHVTELGRALVRAGAEVEVWTHDRMAHSGQSRVDSGVTVRSFPVTRSGRFPVAPRLFRRAASWGAQGFDIVHAHGYHSVAALATLLPRINAPIVFTPHYHGTGHTPLASALHRPYRFVGARLFAAAAAVVCVSEPERDLVLRDFPFARACTSVIHNAVSLERIHAARPFADEPPTVLVLGRIETYKRVDAVMRAFDQLDHPGQLVVIGEGPDAGRVELQRRALRRRRDIRLLGRLDDAEVGRWLRTARCVVSMSEKEAFGIVALEGVAAGAHVVISDIPAHRTVRAIAPRGAVTLTSVDELPHSLRDALDAPPASPRIVRSWDAAAHEHISLYTRVLGRAGQVELPDSFDERRSA